MTYESTPRKGIVKEKVAVFIIATAVLLLSLILMEFRIFSFLGFLLVLLVVFVGANAAFRLIDRRRKNAVNTA
jgi:thiol:disulfide interchange protein